VLATKEKFEYDTLGVLNRMETDQQTGGSVFLAGVNLTTDTLNRLTKESFTYWGISTTSPVDITSGYTFSNGGGSGDDPSVRRSLNYGGSSLAIGTTPDAIGRLETVSMTPAGGAAFDLASYKWAGSQPVQRLLKYGAGTTPHTQTTSFGYDAYRRLSSLSDKRDGQSNPYSAFSFEWDPAGNLLKEIYTKKQGGAGDQFNYDGFDRVVGGKLGVTTMSDPYATAAAAKEIVYGLDPGNSRSSVTEIASGGTPSLTSYATFGNNYRYETILGNGGASPQYDNEGNLTYDGRFQYVYDFKNRLSEIWVATTGTAAMSSQARLSAAKEKNAQPVRASKRSLQGVRKTVLDRFNGGLDYPIKKHKDLQAQGLLDAQGTTEDSQTYTLSLVAIYGYDPMNRRILRIIPGSVDHRYAYDRWREVEEVTPIPDEQGNSVPLVLKDFVWGSRIDELICYRRQESLGTWVSYFPTQGKMDNVVALHRQDGTLVETVEYDPYGKASVFVGNSTTPVNTSSVENPYLFQGRRLDPETGFLYFRNRYLHTGWGRFLTNDPIGVWGDSNSLGNGVAFVGNNPGFGSDPSGLLSLYDTGGSVGYSGGGSGGGGGGWTCGTPNIPGSGAAGGAGANGTDTGEGSGSTACPCEGILVDDPRWWEYVIQWVQDAMRGVADFTTFGYASDWRASLLGESEREIHFPTAYSAGFSLYGGALTVASLGAATPAIGGEGALLFSSGRTTLSLVGAGATEAAAARATAAGIGTLVTLELYSYAKKVRINDKPCRESGNGPKGGNRQLKRLSKGEVEELKKRGFDIHELKDGHRGYDLFKDQNVDVWMKALNGRGEPVPLDVNVHH